MKKHKPIITHTPEELAAALGLSPLDGAEIEVKAEGASDEFQASLGKDAGT